MEESVYKESIYDRTIDKLGLPYLNYKRKNLIVAPTAEVMSTYSDTLDSHSIYRISDLKAKLSRLGIPK